MLSRDNNSCQQPGTHSPNTSASASPDMLSTLLPLMRSCVCTLVTAAALSCTLSTVTRANDFDQIVAFGDSLMDSGNAFVLTGAVATPPFAPVPSAAYAIGGHHFSNGPTWVEQLGQALGLQRSTGPSARNPKVFSNYAVGGARARDVPGSSSASQQLEQYLAFSNGAASSSALYLFGFGGNDVRDALAMGPVNGPPLVGAAVNAITTNLLNLCSAGAMHILIANVPNVGTTPLAQSFGEPAITGAMLLSAGLNNGVQFFIANVVQPSCPETRFYTLDLYALSSAVFGAPGLYGFSDAQPCLAFDQTGNSICRKPNTKFFWDAIHPTKAGHKLVAADAVKVLLMP
ncbi:MAG: SGNH/GDSL hydrolase family protein [Gammaproteobacteria bacterium]|nr:SGNH/GDSL hydrolase family protein [Gammaproteobacteria bacterium]